MRRRRSLRLRGYDYGRPGAYFLTLKTYDKQRLFGTIRSGLMILNEFGRIAQDCWHAIPDHFPHIHLDAYVIMPDHMHGIVWIADDDYTGFDDRYLIEGNRTSVDHDCNCIAMSNCPERCVCMGFGDGRMFGGYVGAKNFSPLHIPQTHRNTNPPSGHPWSYLPPWEPAAPLLIPDRNPARFSWMNLPTDAVPFRSPSRTVGSVVRGFKVGVTKLLRWEHGIYPVWQRGFYDRIITTERGLRRARGYILENPSEWKEGE